MIYESQVYEWPLLRANSLGNTQSRYTVNIGSKTLSLPSFPFFSLNFPFFFLYIYTHRSYLSPLVLMKKNWLASWVTAISSQIEKLEDRWCVAVMLFSSILAASLLKIIKINENVKMLSHKKKIISYMHINLYIFFFLVFFKLIFNALKNLIISLRHV